MQELSEHLSKPIYASESSSREHLSERLSKQIDVSEYRSRALSSEPGSRFQLFWLLNWSFLCFFFSVLPWLEDCAFRIIRSYIIQWGGDDTSVCPVWSKMFDQSAKHFSCRSVKHFQGLSNIGSGLSNISKAFLNSKLSAPQSSCRDYIPFAYERF